VDHRAEAARAVVRRGECLSGQLWGERSGVPEQTLVRASRTELGVAAFEQAVRLYPGRRVTLQEGALIIRDSRFDVIAGGKRFA